MHYNSQGCGKAISPCNSYVFFYKCIIYVMYGLLNDGIINVIDKRLKNMQNHSNCLVLEKKC